MPLVITKQVRKIMRAYGKKIIYTNKLVKHRTIKCYAHQGINVSDIMITDIKNQLTYHKIPHTIRLHTTKNFYGDVTAIIVQIPKE